MIFRTNYMLIRTAPNAFLLLFIVVLTMNATDAPLFAAEATSSPPVDSGSSVDKLLSEAKMNSDRGNLDAAEAILRTAIAMKPQDPTLLEASLEVFFKNGKIDDLLALIDAAYKKHPADMKLLNMLINWKEHPIEERLTNTLKFLKSNPDRSQRIQAYKIAFDCYFRLYRMDEAAKALAELESYGVTDSDFYYRKARYANYSKKYNDALSFISKSINDGRWKLLSLRERAFAFYKLGRYSESLKDLDTYIDEIKNDRTSMCRALETRGKLYFELKNYPAAIKNFSAAIEQADYPETDYFKRAESYLALNKLNDANDDLRSSLKLQPLNAEAHQLLSVVLLRQGKREDSQKESSLAAKYRKI